MGAEAGGGRKYIASTIHKADNRAYTRETLQPRACAALDRESAPSKCERATGRHENLPHLDDEKNPSHFGRGNFYVICYFFVYDTIYFV